MEAVRKISAGGGLPFSSQFDLHHVNTNDVAHEHGRAQVTAFSRWERELPKLLGDARFSAVATTKDRRALFDEYCKEVGTAARGGAQKGKGDFAEAHAPCPSAISTIRLHKECSGFHVCSWLWQLMQTEWSI